MTEATVPRDVRNTSDYFSKMPIQVGAFAGVMGSFAIILVITALAAATGQDIWLSPRVIASVLLGGGAATGFLPVILGTVMHLLVGAVYGAIFAYLVNTFIPSLPRGFWFVVGLVFGIAIWGIAVVAMPPFVALEALNADGVTYFSGLIISHATFGIILGIAGSIYGYRFTNNA